MTFFVFCRSIYLREDKVGPTSRADILANASITEEDYFVAPPGNIPLESSSSSMSTVGKKKSKNT
jgi:hypothetical protein